ncbi:hypothetical protein, partial [Streptomyces sp. NPDC059166]|uniref:hypothetical protein n=1 Tax=Streptomyces sp. NPDC059166 TaxID=3346752 RepID=UPI003691E0B7
MNRTDTPKTDSAGLTNDIEAPLKPVLKPLISGPSMPPGPVTPPPVHEQQGGCLYVVRQGIPVGFGVVRMVGLCGEFDVLR